MFVSKCISILLSGVISINSSVIWVQPTQKDSNIIVDVIETPIVEIQEEIPQEPIIEEIVEVIEPEEPVASTDLPLSESEIDLIALVTMAEAEGESELGKRLVIDVILNRYDSSRFSNTISGVIYAKNAFECMTNERINRCYVREDIRQLVIEELQYRTNSNIHYFRTNHYHSFGKPVIQEGNHYFSTY